MYQYCIMFLEVSKFAAATGRNPFVPKEQVMLLVKLREDPIAITRLLYDQGYIEFDSDSMDDDSDDDSDEDSDDEDISEVWTLADTLADNVKTTEQCQEAIALLNDLIDKETLNKKDAKEEKNDVRNLIYTSMGINCENDAIEELKGKATGILPGNKRMYYKKIGENWTVGGKFDAITDDTILEIKTRTSRKTIRKNKYDLIQLLGYMFVTDKKKGKIIQKYNSNIYDSSTNNRKEWGLIHFNSEQWDKFLNCELIPFFEECENSDPPISILPKPFARMIDVDEDYEFESLQNPGHWADNLIKLLSFPYEQQSTSQYQHSTEESRHPEPPQHLHP